MTTEIIAKAYDAVFEAAARSPALDRIWRETVTGSDYPEGFEHLSFVTPGELRTLADALRVRGGDVFADLGCGAGGPGLWVARETGATVIGVDVSAVALRLAEARAATLGLAEAARYAPGSFASSGLGDASVHAVLSVDAMQYAPDKHDAVRETARIVRPGGRVAFTTFEVRPEAVAGLPGLGDDPVEDFRPLLDESGLAVVSYDETPGWDERVESFSRAILDGAEAIRPEVGETAAAILSWDAATALERRPYRRRILAVAERR